MVEQDMKRTIQAHSPVLFLSLLVLLCLPHQFANGSTRIGNKPVSPVALRREAAQLLEKARETSLRGHAKQALPLFQRALSLYRKAHDRQGEGTSLNDIGVTYAGLGRFANALESFRQAKTIRHALQDRAGESNALTNIGTVYANLGRYDDAYAAHLQAWRLAAESGESIAEALAGYNMAKINSYRGLYAEALKDFQGIAGFFSRAGVHDGEAATLTSMAEVYTRLGRYADALEQLQRARALRRETRSSTDEAETIASIGRAYMGIGQPGKALQFFMEARKIWHSAENRPYEAAVLDDIGAAYSKMRQFETALRYHHQARAIRQELGDRLGEAATLRLMGAACRGLGRNQEALDLCRRALTIERARHNRPGEAATLSEIGAIHYTQRQHAKAMAALRQALQLVRAEQPYSDRVQESVLLDSIGSVQEGQGRLREALNSYMEAMRIAERVRTSARIEEFKTSFAEQSVNVYERAVRVLLRMRRLPEAFNTVERARARTFLDQIGNARPDIRRGADAVLLQREQSLNAELQTLDRELRRESVRSGPGWNWERMQALKSRIAARQRQYENALAALKLANPEYASLVSVEPITLSALQKRLDSKTTLLSYFVMRDKTLAFVVSRSALKAFELQGEKHLREAVTEFRRFGSLKDHAKPPPVQRLYNWLIAPLQPHLKTSRIGIIPHGVLHYLPFAALENGSRVWGDDRVLFYLPSASILPFVQNERQQAGEGLLALAQSQAEGFPVLQHADDEVREICQLYPGSQPILTGEATKLQFKAHAPECEIVHLAVHGDVDPQSPLFSRLMLAPTAEDSGALEVREIYGLNLTKVDLVVLSACRTQLGSQSRGDVVVSLNRAFLYAGAHAVVASLWKVDDAATKFLMWSFYRHLAQGLGKGEALQAAQRDTRLRYGDPRFWAAFVLTGTPERSSVAATSNLGDAVLSSSLFPAQYAVTDLGTLGGNSSAAFSINNNGQIVGQAETSSGSIHPFLWQSGTMIDLRPEDASSSVAHDINNSGQVVGGPVPTGLVPLERGHAFLWANGQLKELGTLGGANSSAWSINDGGQVVGSSEVSRTKDGLTGHHAFLWNEGRMYDLGTLGGQSSYAASINDHGQVVGQSLNPSNQMRAFRWTPSTPNGTVGRMIDLGSLPGCPLSAASAINNQGQVVGLSERDIDIGYAFSIVTGRMTNLGTLRGTHSTAESINNQGQVVGASRNDRGEMHAFLWNSGRMADLNSLIPAEAGWVLISARGINDRGQVVGVGLYRGEERAFLLTPK